MKKYIFFSASLFLLTSCGMGTTSINTPTPWVQQNTKAPISTVNDTETRVDASQISQSGGTTTSSDNLQIQPQTASQVESISTTIPQDIQ